MAHAALLLSLSWLLDAIWGEPPNALHPVVWMGRAITPLKRVCVRRPVVELVLGATYTALVAFGFAGLTWLLQRGLRPWPILASACEVSILFGCFALKGLLRAGAEMHAALTRGDLTGARDALRSLCSRDPSELTPSELAGATIESLTENTSDSIVAPLFFYVLFGLPGAVFYRAANTMDAMVGYHGRFEYLGKAAARLDDLLNLIPARITALLLLLSGAALGLSATRGVAVWWRDRGRTESPNAGHPMAMAAGLLGVRVDKREAYVLFASGALPDPAALEAALRLVRATGWVAAMLFVSWLAARGGVHVVDFG